MPYCNGMMLACISHLQDVLKCSVASLLLFLQIHVGSMLELLCSGQKNWHSTSMLPQTCLKHHNLEVPHLIGQLLDLDSCESLLARVVLRVMIPIWPSTLLSLKLGDCGIHSLVRCVVQQLGALQIHMFVSKMQV